MRLIDADALIAQAEEEMFACEADQFAAMVSWIPTIDAVPVVRCKDCKFATVNELSPRKPLVCGLTKMCGVTLPNWFCAAGERRSDDG